MTAWRRGKAQGSYPLQSLFLSAFEFAAFSLNKFILYKLHPHPFGFVNHGWCIFQNGIDNWFFIGRMECVRRATRLVLFASPIFDPSRRRQKSFAHKTAHSIGGPGFITFSKAVPVAVTMKRSNVKCLSRLPLKSRWNRPKAIYNHSCSCNICIPELKIFGQFWFFWQRASQRCAQCNQPITAPRLFFKH